MWVNVRVWVIFTLNSVTLASTILLKTMLVHNYASSELEWPTLVPNRRTLFMEHINWGLNYIQPAVYCTKWAGSLFRTSTKRTNLIKRTSQERFYITRRFNLFFITYHALH